MLGYVRIEKSNLRFKDYYKYKNIYCALCAQMRKDYGILSCLLLSYDVTFLFLILETVIKFDDHQTIRCPLNPIKKREITISEDVSHYCAFINYHLALLKIMDDVHDSKSTAKRLLGKLVKRNHRYQDALSKYKSIVNDLDRQYSLVGRAEREDLDIETSITRFANFFLTIFSAYLAYKGITPENGFAIEISNLLFALGEWIYVIDAYDDIKKDVQHKEYNLLKKIYEQDMTAQKEKYHKYVNALILMLIAKMRESLTELKKMAQHDWYLIENICLYACLFTYTKIKKERYQL